MRNITTSSNPQFNKLLKFFLFCFCTAMFIICAVNLVCYLYYNRYILQQSEGIGQ